MESDGLLDESSMQELSNQSTDQEFTRPSTSTTPSTGSKRSLGSRSNVSNKKVLQLVADRLKRNDATEGKHASFGKHVAEELNNMPPEIIPFVKKNINDAIFEGQMKSLNRTSSIITHSPQGKFWTTQSPQGQFSTTQSRRGQFSTINYTPTETSSENYTAADYFSQFSNK